jgi:hypothetical protein
LPFKQRLHWLVLGSVHDPFPAAFSPLGRGNRARPARPAFATCGTSQLSQLTGLELIEAPNHFKAQGAQDAAVQASGCFKTLAASLMKIANDLRFLGSGPRLGLGELEIPAVQPGSSIMPGKVNPVIAESLTMVCAQVIGNDTVITLGGPYGNFELNAMLPVIARNLLEQIGLLSNAGRIFADKLVAGLTANRERIAAMNEQSLSLATVLVPRIGYDAAAAIAQESYRTGKTPLSTCGIRPSRASPRAVPKSSPIRNSFCNLAPDPSQVSMRASAEEVARSPTFNAASISHRELSKRSRHRSFWSPTQSPNRHCSR